MLQRRPPVLEPGGIEGGRNYGLAEVLICIAWSHRVLEFWNFAFVSSLVSLCGEIIRTLLCRLRSEMDVAVRRGSPGNVVRPLNS